MTRLVMLRRDAAAKPKGQAPPVVGPAFLDTAQGAGCELFLLDPAADPDPWGSLRAVREHANPAIYLRPVLVAANADEPLRAAVDGIWYPSDMGSTRPATADDINRRAQPYLEAGPDRAIGLKLLRFIATRADDFEPRPTTASTVGFIYPRLEPFQPDPDEGALSTLEVLAEQRLLSGRLVTRAHNCAHCGCSFLNFLEVCPHCQTVDIASDDLVHHFRCGFTAELADFQRDDGWFCPKCRGALGNVGVDYDKPAVVYRCRVCALDFQEPEVRSRCFACGRGAPPEEQVQREIHAYSITALGRNAAALGFEGLFLNVVSQRLNLWSWESFTQLLDIEAARIARYGRSESSVLVMALQGIETVYTRLGRRSREVFEEIAQVLTSILRRCDIVTARSETLFVALLPETEVAGAQRVAERVEDGLDELVTQNFDVVLSVASDAQPVNEDLAVTTFLEGFLAYHGH